VAAKFVLLGLDRQVPLQLGRPNGQVIATSEAYETKASAINGIESVKRNAPSAEIDNQSDQWPAVLLDAGIGLAVPGRPIGLWGRGGPERRRRPDPMGPEPAGTQWVHEEPADSR
jgi:hypothetical protein